MKVIQKSMQTKILKNSKSIGLREITGGALALIFSLVLMNCSPKTQKANSTSVKSTQSEADVIKSQEEYRADVEKFRAETHARIAQNKIEIDDLKSKFSEEDKESNKELKAEIEVIEQKNELLKKKLNEYNTTNKEKWASFKEEVNHDMSAIGLALKDLTVRNKK
jgi:predicted RNase H-like nuclease (RuvC/YqgF family)